MYWAYLANVHLLKRTLASISGVIHQSLLQGGVHVLRANGCRGNEA
jgi:hypothetical protein